MPSPLAPKTSVLSYIRSFYAPEDALLVRAREAAEALGHGWQIGAEEGRLLQWLIRLAGVRSIVEIGTLTGYSALWMARALPEGGMLHAIDHDGEHCRMAAAHFAASEVKERIALYHGKALSVLESLAPLGPFDMAFIDADKISYPDYLDWAEANIRSGGLIVADNTLLFGAVYGENERNVSPAAVAAMQRFNERLASRSRYDAVMIPTNDGMSVAVKL